MEEFTKNGRYFKKDVIKRSVVDKNFVENNTKRQSFLSNATGHFFKINYYFYLFFLEQKLFKDIKWTHIFFICAFNMRREY